MITLKEMHQFITENYPDVTERILDHTHTAGFCPKCNREMGLQILSIQTALEKTQYGPADDFSWPYMAMLRCPICKLFSFWILQKVDRVESVAHAAVVGATVLTSAPARETLKKVTRIFRIAAIPPEGKYEIPELPQEPQSLRKAYREAIQCLNNNCPMAAAAMFRRALQIITRDILGAAPSTLAKELALLVSKPNKLGVTLTKAFETNSYILREVGNQGAHPDQDPDLLTFTPEDAEALYSIFLELVGELFVIPAAAAAAKQKLIERRKL